MKLIELLEDEKTYKRYMLKENVKPASVIVYAILGFVFGIFFKVFFAITFHFVLPFGTGVVTVVLAILWLLSIFLRQGKRIHIYYESIGDEKEIEVTEQCYIEKLGESIDEIAWDKLLGIKQNDRDYTIQIEKRPPLILCKEKLPSHFNEILNTMYVRYHDSWMLSDASKDIKKQGMINTTDVAEPLLTQEIDNGYYVEMTQERYLRRSSLYAAFKGFPLGLLGPVIIFVPLAIRLLFSPIILLIVALVIFIFCWLIKRNRIKNYQRMKDKLSYTFQFNGNKGIIVKDFYSELMVNWDQVKKIVETKKDFFIYCSETRYIMIPKDILNSGDLLFFHKKC